MDDAVRPTPFLDVAPVRAHHGRRARPAVRGRGPGLRRRSGKVYVYYTDSGGDIRIDEFTRSAARPGDRGSRHPQDRARDRALERGRTTTAASCTSAPDGCLWVTTGDGGGQNNEHDNSQNLGTLLGQDPAHRPRAARRGPARVRRLAGPSPGPGGGQPDTTAPAGVRARAAPPAGAAPARRDRVRALQRALLAERRRDARDRPPQAPAAAGARGAHGRLHHARSSCGLRPRARRVLRAALRRGRRPRVELRLRATDAAGNRSALVRRGSPGTTLGAVPGSAAPRGWS